MGAKNQVIIGDHLNRYIRYRGGSPEIEYCYVFGEGSKDAIPLNKDTVEKYEIIDEQTQKSAASAIGRGLVGSIVFGSVGLLAGLSAKSKGIHVLAIQFKDGKKSIIEVDDKIYQAIFKKMF